MNEQQYYQWKIDMINALINVYTREQATIIVDWFDTVKTRKEMDLMGDEYIEFYMNYSRTDRFSLYNSLSSRAWDYAEAILKDAE